MTKRITPPFDETAYTQELISGGVAKILQKKGRLPPVSIRVKPLDQSMPIFFLDRFMSYEFKSSLLIPVDSFMFDFFNPDSTEPFTDRVFEGDHITLYANNQHIATGIVDTIEIETEADGGEKVRITGRDLMCQLEDQDCVNLLQKQVPTKKTTIDNVISELTKNTRMLSKPLLRGCPATTPYLFSTSPGETKLSALQRFLEPLNVIAWMSPGGQMIVGKPGFLNPQPKGRFFCSKTQRTSNLMSIRVIKSAATIPNILVSILSCQDRAQDKFPSQVDNNAAKGPSRLRKLGHYLPKTLITSNPDGGSPQDQSVLNNIDEIRRASVQLGRSTDYSFSNVLKAYSKREIARVNQQEIIVQVTVAGHYNEDGEPFQTDTIYTIDYERASLHEDMLLFQCDFKLDETGGQITNLYFCRKGTIVPDQLIK